MKNSIIFLTLLFTLFASSNALARISGNCADCHTMHNSQDGDPLEVDGEPKSTLLKQDCVGCHTGDISASSTDRVPYVFETGSAAYGPDYVEGSLVADAATNTLAGGTFSFVTANPTFGHNVVGISAEDSMGTLPPGWSTGFSNTVGNEVAGLDSAQLTCAGTTGCHGDHASTDEFKDIAGAHHGDDSQINGATVTKSYRFLSGIIGYEDWDWELTVSATDHNTYSGVNRTNLTTATGLTADVKETISYLCAQCHGNFHASDSTTDGIISAAAGVFDNSNPWLRHPSDFSLTSAGGEYLSYADASGTPTASPGIAAVYNFVTPVASANIGVAADNNASTSTTPPTDTLEDPFGIAGDDIVTCLSCHRAHGSAYPDLLRWDYGTMDAGSGYINVGCFACHTSKN